MPIKTVQNLRVNYEGHLVYMTESLTAMWQGWRWRAAQAKLEAQEQIRKWLIRLEPKRNGDYTLPTETGVPNYD